MSIDLDWSKLDSTLATSLVDVLNRQLQSAPRPSFIGPVQITSFDFGTQPPDIELVDLCDIHRDFIDDDDLEPDGDPVKVTEGPPRDDDDDFEWVSRRAALADDGGPAYHHLPPHVRYGRGPASDMFASLPGPSRDSWAGPMTMSMPGLSPRASYHAPSQPQTQSPYPSTHRTPPSATDPHSHYATRHPSRSPSPSPPPPREPSPPPAQSPDMQIHLRVSWHSNLRLALTTSLRINYPSPMFMALPIRLAVTGLLFTGEVAVAHEGSRGRVHLCVLDDMDPYAPRRGGRRAAAGNGTPSEEGEGGAGAGPRADKPLPVGQRLLPNIFIESELGQADRHVLKNVARVERFIQDVIRKTVEEELVFPNFHTLVLQ